MKHETDIDHQNLIFFLFLKLKDIGVKPNKLLPLNVAVTIMERTDNMRTPHTMDGAEALKQAASFPSLPQATREIQCVKDQRCRLLVLHFLPFNE